ncbi:MAG: MliC family protein [Casimicrobiaceae bacterium]|nr:MliC family protein [Casimicrobiaceae bacterium]
MAPARKLFALCVAALLAGCAVTAVDPGRAGGGGEPQPTRVTAGTADVGTVRMSAYLPLAFEVRFDCGGELVRFGMVGDRPTLVIGAERISLKPAAAASGARYEGEADASVEFWSRGREATLRAQGRSWPTCRALG